MTSYSIGCTIIEKFSSEGYTAYFAGGWVRDFLMNHPSDDIDIATNASVNDVQKLFAKTIPVGINFGIIIVVENGHQFEVATFRKDQGYIDGRRPSGIEKSNPQEDAKRRDFTINGMFYDPIKKQLFDFVNGQEDIKMQVIRAIGNPHERFLEDRLRMIRAVRYASRFNFSIENETLKAILDHADALFPAVAMERIWHELIKMAAFNNFDLALVTLHKLNLLPVIFPSLKDTSLDEIKKRVRLLPSFPSDAPVIAKVLELFPKASLQEKKDLCSYLKLSNNDKEFLIYYHKSKEFLLSQKDKDRYEWAHFYANQFYPICLKIIAVHFCINKRQTFLQKHHMQYESLKKAIGRIQKKELILSSKKLRQAGIPNGIKMGKLMKEGECLAINKSIDDVDKIIEHLKKTALWEE